MNHKGLVMRSATWLQNQGAVVLATEVSAWHCPESPDVIGWKYDGISVVIEAKISRADFLADKNKPHRNGKVIGLGNYRYYAAPAGLIEPSELPEGWGLIESSGNGMRQRKAAVVQESNQTRERVLLVQLMRYRGHAEWCEKHNVRTKQPDGWISE